MVGPANVLSSLEDFPWNIFGTCDKAAAQPLGALIVVFCENRKISQFLRSDSRMTGCYSGQRKRIACTSYRLILDVEQHPFLNRKTESHLLGHDPV